MQPVSPDAHARPDLGARGQPGAALGPTLPVAPGGLRLTSVARLEPGTRVPLGPEFHRNQSIDGKGKEAELQSGEKNPSQEPKRRTLWASRDIPFRHPSPHFAGSIAKSLSQVDAGLASPGLGSRLVWTLEGSEIGVAGRKGGQGKGQLLRPGLSPPRSPGPQASASPRFCSRWTGCCGLLGERAGQGCLSRQISGSEQPRGPLEQSGIE